MKQTLLLASIVFFVAGCSCSNTGDTPCANTSECPAKSVCLAGFCKESTGASCTKPADCGLNEQCVSGLCVAGGTGGGTGGGGGTMVMTGTGCDPNRSDNATRDSDCDGLNDAEEYSTVYGGTSHTDPCYGDTDHDGILDGVEMGRTSTVAQCSGFVADADPTSKTDPTSKDSDGDTLEDGAEDKNRDGRVDPGESNPTRVDSDCDGISDADEVNGTKGCATDPLKVDTDGDGLPDGVEQGVQAPGADNGTCKYSATLFDTDTATKTNACGEDSDGDGVMDGAEDGNHNGKVDMGELDPKAPGDAAGPAQTACATGNLRPVTIHSTGYGDVELALAPSFADVSKVGDGMAERGIAFYDPTNQIAGFVISVTPAGNDANADEALGRVKLGSVSGSLVQNFTTWDNFAQSVRATYDHHGPGDLKTRVNDVLKAYLGGGATGLLANAASVSGPYKVQAEYVRRTGTRSLVLVAITPAASYSGQQLFRVDDTAGGTALAQFGDFTATGCEVFAASVNAKVDFLWVVDDSCSMADSQDAVGNAGNLFAQKLTTAGLDWRAGAVTTSFYADSSAFRGFTNASNIMKTWFDKNSVNWFGTDGFATEEALVSTQSYVQNTLFPRTNDPSQNKLRDGASLHLIVLSDTEDQSPGSAMTYASYFMNYDGSGAKATVHGILCPEGTSCNDEDTVGTPGRVQSAIRTTGGVIGDINVFQGTSTQDRAQQANTIDAIVSAAIGGTGHQLTRPPINATIKVAIEPNGTRGTCFVNDVPRDRNNGWDIDSATRRMVFYGNCIPKQAGIKVAVSYKYWNDNSPDVSGDPCGGMCVAPYVCEPGTKACVCAPNCGGVCGAGFKCAPSSCSCEPEIT